MITQTDVRALMKELNKQDDGVKWEAYFDGSDERFVSEVFSDLHMPKGDVTRKLVLVPAGYFFTPHCVADEFSDKSMEILTKFFEEHKLVPRSVWLQNEFVDNIYERMVQATQMKPWEPALYDNIMAAAILTENYLEKNASEKPETPIMLQQINAFKGMVQLCPANMLAEVTMKISEHYPDAKVILNMDNVHEYNNDNSNSAFLIVVGYDDKKDLQFIQPTPLTTMEAMQLALMGYAAHCQNPLF